MMRTLAWITVLLLAGCATTPRVEVASDPQADFSRYDTFTFQSPLGTDRQEGVSTLLSQTLKETARAELTRRGYRYVEGDADLKVNFFVETREVVEGLRRPGIGFSYGIFHRHYGVWADYETDVRQYTEGTLHVDVIDTARNQLVWEGVARRRLEDRDFVFEPEAVRSGVRRVFERFPGLSPEASASPTGP
jgi:hypothetical protein